MNYCTYLKANFARFMLLTDVLLKVEKRRNILSLAKLAPEPGTLLLTGRRSATYVTDETAVIEEHVTAQVASHDFRVVCVLQVFDQLIVRRTSRGTAMTALVKVDEIRVHVVIVGEQDLLALDIL